VRGSADRPATQDRSDPGGELAHGERLDHVIVRSELEADDAIDLLPASGEHDDGHV
jgi:hypothetical protein